MTITGLVDFSIVLRILIQSARVIIIIVNLIGFRLRFWREYQLALLNQVAMVHAQFVIIQLGICFESAQSTLESIDDIAGEPHERRNKGVESDGRPSCQFVKQLFAIVLDLLLV